MSALTVLVLDGHSRAALETLQSLGRAGVQVDLAAEAHDCLAMHSRYVSRKLQQPQREINTGIYGKRQRSPQARVNFHQPVLAVGVHLEFNHRYAVPIEGR